MAISLILKTPFNKIRRNTMRISMLQSYCLQAFNGL
jgi:hypothetical protein